MFRVMLIEPHQMQRRVSSTREMLVAQEGKYPLGILSVATYLKNNSDFLIKILDYSNNFFNETEFIEMLKTYSPNVIGISANSYKIDTVFYLLQLCKQHSSASTVVGGFHLYLYPKQTLSFSEVDYIIIGDGEVPFLELCRHLPKSDMETAKIKGVYSKQDLTKDIFSPYMIEDINSLPPPNPDLLNDINKKTYLAPLSRRRLAIIVKSRGCPHHCSFCISTLVKYRTLSVKRLLEYVKFYLHKGIRELEFYDDTFNDNLQFVDTFLDEIIKQKLNFEWAVRGLRLKKISKELAIKMKKAGCTRVQVGIESASNRILQLMRRQTNKEEMRHAINCFHLARIQVVGNFIFGFPYETMEDLNETIDFIFDAKPDFLAIHIFEMHPKSPIYLELLKKGLFEKDCYEEYFSHPVGPPPLVQLEGAVEKKDLIALRDKTISNYYFTIGYFLQVLRKMRVSQLRGSLRLGSAVFSDYLIAKDHRHE